MLEDPTGKVDVGKLALPAFSVFVAKAVLPFMKATFPVGVPLTCGKIVAVKVTGFPCTDGLADETNAVLLVALFTTCETVAEVLPVKLASPL
jgi:hypothetical protein